MSGQWAAATLNLPIRQGAQVWASGHSRAEVQFDDGTLLRLGADAVVTLQTLYSDSQGEFTELRLSQGLASLTVPHGKSVFQVDTLTASLKAAGPARFRVGASPGTEVAVRQGKVNLEDAQGKTFLEAGDYTDIVDPKAAFDIQDLPAEDGWDQFNDQRDQAMAEGTQDKNLSSQEGLVAGNLDDYGRWQDDFHYGKVWVPAEPVSWRPYHDGHWVWVEPFGWTWVGDEPWGWAPYHYGSWVHLSAGWGWCPGPHIQFWSPAVVDFVGCDGAIAWAPLCPSEVHYPSFFSVGFGGGNWSLFFSIGGCATYAYGGHGYCNPRRWDNVYCNRVTNITNIYNVHGGYRGFGPDRSIAPVRPGGWVPTNARLADGVSRVGPEGFGGPGRFAAVPRSEGASLFARGHSVAGTGFGRQAFSGPAGVRPTEAAFTPTHTFLTGARPSPAVLSRPVYRAAVAPNIARVGGRGGAFLAPSNRAAFPSFRGGPAFAGPRPAFNEGHSAFGDGRSAQQGGRSAFGGFSRSPDSGLGRSDGAYFHQREFSGGSTSGGYRGGGRSFGGGSPQGGGGTRSFGGGRGFGGGGSGSVRNSGGGGFGGGRSFGGGGFGGRGR